MSQLLSELTTGRPQFKTDAIDYVKAILPGLVSKLPTDTEQQRDVLAHRAWQIALAVSKIQAVALRTTAAIEPKSTRTPRQMPNA